MSTLKYGTKLGLLCGVLFSILSLSVDAQHNETSVTIPGNPPELVAYWPLAESTLNAVADTNHGVAVGGVGFEDSAAVLNGQDSFINFGSSLSITGSLSMCFWLNPDAEDRLLRVLGKFQISDNNREYCLFLNTGNRLWIFMSDDGSADPGHAFLKTTLLPAAIMDRWSHLAVTWESSQGPAGLRVYADGQPLPTADAQVSDIHGIHAGAADLTLGTYDVPVGEEQPVPVNPFSGRICQFALFRGVLSETGVREIHELGRVGDFLAYFSTFLPEHRLPGRLGGSSASDRITGSHRSVSAARPEDDISDHGNGKVIYVDCRNGDDRLSGHARSSDGVHGPKKTINGGLGIADETSTIYVAGGNYHEAVKNSKARIIATGRVVVK